MFQYLISKPKHQNITSEIYYMQTITENKTETRRSLYLFMNILFYGD